MAEYYSFIVVRSAVRSLPPVLRTTLFTLYLSLTALSWMGLIFFRQVNWNNVPHLVRNLYMAFVLGFVVGKVLIMLVMFIDDIRRLFTWLITSMVSKNSTTADTATTIDRSTFMRQAALVLGGISVLISALLLQRVEEG
jgi:hypothetical protein